MNRSERGGSRRSHRGARLRNLQPAAKHQHQGEQQEDIETVEQCIRTVLHRGRVSENRRYEGDREQGERTVEAGRSIGKFPVLGREDLGYRREILHSIRLQEEPRVEDEVVLNDPRIRHERQGEEQEEERSSMRQTRVQRNVTRARMPSVIKTLS